MVLFSVSAGGLSMLKPVKEGKTGRRDWPRERKKIKKWKKGRRRRGRLGNWVTRLALHGRSSSSIGAVCLYSPVYPPPLPAHLSFFSFISRCWAWEIASSIPASGSLDLLPLHLTVRSIALTAKKVNDSGIGHPAKSVTELRAIDQEVHLQHIPEPGL